MTRRKGELTPAAIDRGWPHQVVMLASLSQGKAGAEQAVFCEQKRLLRCVRGHSLFFEDQHYNVHCFATRAHAQTFLEEYGGEWFNPAERGKGINWNQWYKGSAGRRP